MPNDPWTLEEQETIVNIGRTDDLVRIWTNIPAHVRAFSKKTAVSLVRSGNENGQPWAEYTIPKNQYSPVSGVKRASKPLTEEQKLAVAARLAKARDAK